MGPGLRGAARVGTVRAAPSHTATGTTQARWRGSRKAMTSQHGPIGHDRAPLTSARSIWGDIVNATTGRFADPPPGRPPIDGVLARLSQSLHGLLAEAGDDADRFLAKMTRIAHRDIPGADPPGITLIEHPDKIRSLSATSPQPLTLDSLRQRCGCGLCL